MLVQKLGKDADTAGHDPVHLTMSSFMIPCWHTDTQKSRPFWPGS